MAVMESRSDSPRTSISYDFGPPGSVASVEKRAFQSCPLSNISSDFCFQSNNDNQAASSTAADELFLDGKILPVQINKRIDNVSSKQMLAPPLLTYVHTNNSRLHCSKVNNMCSNILESPPSDNSLALSVKIKKNISVAKQLQPKPFTPLHELLNGTTTSLRDEAPNCKSYFKVKVGAGDGKEQHRQALKSMRRSVSCCGLKSTSGNGGFRGGFCPFLHLFRRYSVGSVQNSSKVVSSSPRNSEKHQQNPTKLKELRPTSLVRHKSPSLKQLILTDHKLHNSLPVRNRKPSLKQLIVIDNLIE